MCDLRKGASSDALLSDYADVDRIADHDVIVLNVGDATDVRGTDDEIDVVSGGDGFVDVGVDVDVALGDVLLNDVDSDGVSSYASDVADGDVVGNVSGDVRPDLGGSDGGGIDLVANTQADDRNHC